FFYLSNGMSESPFLATLWATSYYFLRVTRTSAPWDIMQLGIALAASFLTRYEAVIVIGVVAVGLVVHEAQRRHAQPFLQRVVSLLIGALIIPLYTIAMWMYLNWTIVGSPLYFWNSQYSNAAFIANADPSTQLLKGSLPGAIAYGLDRVLAISPLYPALLVPVVAWLIVRRQWLPLVVVGVWFVVLPFQILLMYQGSSFGWSRYFMFGIGGSVVLAALVLSATTAFPLMTFSRGAAILAMVATPLLGVFTLSAPALSDQRAFAAALLRAETPTTRVGEIIPIDRSITAALDRLSDGLILTDSYESFTFLMTSRQPRRFVITSDRDFREILDSPRGRVSYILVPRTDGFGASDAINQRYPTLFSGGVWWAEQALDFNGQYRVFRVASEAARNDR
ncbi:MAG: hypothetical protein NZ518_07105, partial [Dehalococcoidia bacterium]|nr:hypothetical protein [Dehalococcoidia bacterium]